jgi:5-formyltetrahydrofolate cyclo-ligase
MGDFMATDKEILRKDAILRRGALSKQWRNTADELIAQRLFNTPIYNGCTALFCYVSRCDEIDSREIIKRALKDGKTVAVPKTCMSSGLLNFIPINSLMELREGVMGILEPHQNLKYSLKGDRKTLCVVPALCADIRGFRVGYGGGFYDRFLAEFPGENVTLVYNELLKNAVPNEPHDIPIKWVITEKSIIRTE